MSLSASIFGSIFHFLHARPDQREGRRRGFLHDVTDLAGEGDRPLAGESRGFDEEDFAAEGCIAIPVATPARRCGWPTPVRTGGGPSTFET